MSKYLDELKDYSKASGAFEYAAKRYSANKQDQSLRDEVNATINFLDNVAFPIIEKLYHTNPDDKDAISVYEIASKDRMLMLSIFNNL